MAYTIKYKIPFSSIDKKLYEIRIYQDNYSGNIIELTGGESPINIQYNESDYLYEPLRFSTATLQIVNRDLSDLFSNSYQDYKINLYENDTLLFTGFLTPELYSQTNNGYIENIEIEAVSALATLKYIQYEFLEGNVSIFQLIKDIIIKSNGDYNYIYFPISFGNSTRNILRDLLISSNNFIDEEKEIMTYKDILEEICRFFCWTIIEKNGDVYFIDVDYIKQQKSQYFRYTKSFGVDTIVSFSTDKQIISDTDSTGYNNSLSILNSFNKVSVVCSDYEIDNDILFPSLELKEANPILQATQQKVENDEVYWKEYYYQSEKHDLYNYELNNNTFVRVSQSSLPDALQNRAGCVLIGRTHYDLNDMPNQLNYEYLYQIKLFDNQSVNVLLDSFSDTDFPIMKYSSPIICFDEDIRLCLSFSVQYSDRTDGFVLKDNPNKDDQVDGGNVDGWYIPVQLKIGNLYFDGENWINNHLVYFKVYTDLKRKQQHYSFDFLNARNTNNFLNNTPDLSGTIINQNTAKMGELEMTIYCPKALQDSYLHRYIYLKDIEISSQRINTSKSLNKQDTIYSNVISDSYLSELDDIELKISSKNKSELAFSKLIYNNETLDTISNFYTNNNEKPENIIIQRVVNQYNKPKYQLIEEVSPNYYPYQLVKINSIENKDFIISSELINYRNNNSILTLIELN